MQKFYKQYVEETLEKQIAEFERVDRFVEEAVFSDGTIDYRNPIEPMPGDTVNIRIRVFHKNIEYVRLITSTTRHTMDFVLTTKNGLYDIYEANIVVGDKPVYYYFKIYAKGESYIYNRLGITRLENHENSFLITPGFKTPDWAKGAVFYQIYVDRFRNGDPTNDVLTDEYSYINDHVHHVENWDRLPQAMDVREFYGGDLAGVIEKLDYLADLGIEVIYLNPIFTSPSNHKYDAQDYDCIDPHLGVIKHRTGELLAKGDNINAHATSYIDAVTNPENIEASNKLFIQLVEEVHKRGMKIVLDGVFNHCGSFNKWLDRERIYKHDENYPAGAYESKDSPYHNYFQFYEDKWPDNGAYDGWWGHDTLPKLNYEESKELYDYILEVGRKWVSPPYNCDGWRLDVAADLGHSAEFNHKFWVDFRKAVKEANPEAIILAEHYGDASSWLKGDQWDTVMNYDAFMEPITWFFTGMEKHSDASRPDLLNNGPAMLNNLIHAMTVFQTSSLHVAMNQLSNHDHSRFLTRTNRVVGRTSTKGAEAAGIGINKAVFREAVVFQMTFPGAPAVYYGDEAGVVGWTDPDNRRTYPWGKEDKELIKFHKELIWLRRRYDALRRGSIKPICSSDGIISYLRFDRDDRFLVAFNNLDREQEIKLPIWLSGITDFDPMVRLIQSDESGFSTEAKIYKVENGMLTIKLPRWSSVILKNLKM